MLVASLLTVLTLAPQTPDVTVTLRPDSGPSCVVGASAGFVAQVANGSDMPLVAVLEAWTPPDVALRGLPGSVRLAAGKTGRFPCRVGQPRAFSSDLPFPALRPTGVPRTSCSKLEIGCSAALGSDPALTEYCPCQKSSRAG